MILVSSLLPLAVIHRKLVKDAPGENSGSTAMQNYDFVIVGSGAGSIPAALLAHDNGKSALILEKTDKLGGSTAISGGVIWVPNNSVMQREGITDSYEMAKRYLDACAGPYEPGSTAVRRHAFLTSAPRLVEYLERKGMQFVRSKGWPDYHQGEYPGGVQGSRALEGRIFDLKELGPWRDRLRIMPRPPIQIHEGTTLMLYGRTWTSKLTMLKVGWRMIQNRFGRHLAGTGSSLYGRLLQIAVRNNIEFWTDSPVVDFVHDNARVTGVVVEKGGKRMTLGARNGVLVNSGGFAHNQRMRDLYHNKPSSTRFTMSNPGDTGEMLELMRGLGAEFNYMDLAWYNPMSLLPNGRLTATIREAGLPHCIYVDGSAKRYTNEAGSYLQVGLDAYKRNKTAEALPSWVIFDSQHRKSYVWAGQKPGHTPQEWLDSGYMIQAGSVEALAARCKLDPAALKETLDRFNEFARTGVDADFHRSGAAGMGFHLSDPSHGPNTSLGTIEEPPFYAVRMHIGDVGTAGGVITDEHARVLRRDGSVIEGLYATGNSTAPVAGRSYPGAGFSIANSAVFGFLAAQHALGSPMQSRTNR